MSLLSSEFYKVSSRHVVFFMFAVVISIRCSSFLWSCGLFRQSEGTGDEYDDTDFFFDIYICLFGFLPNREASLLYPLGSFLIQDAV